jgi:hypothetical protein
MKPGGVGSAQQHVARSTYVCRYAYSRPALHLKFHCSFFRMQYVGVYGMHGFPLICSTWDGRVQACKVFTVAIMRTYCMVYIQRKIRTVE